MLPKFFLRLALLSSLIFLACGTNKLKTKAPHSPVEEAQLLLENGDYIVARAKLESYLEENPEDYKAFALLAATFALEAGISIVQLTERAIDSGQKAEAEENSNSLSAGKGQQDIIENILPPPTPENIAALKKARTIILSIPEDERNADIEFGETVYVTAYSLLLIEKLKQETTPPTAEDALEIINSIAAAAELAAKNALPAEKIAEVKEAILKEPGATQEEKLKSYLAKLKTNNAKDSQN